MSKSVSKTRFYIYAIAFLPFLLLLITGVILLKYHSGAPLESMVMNLDGQFWFSFHTVLSIVSTIVIVLHLFVKTNWVKSFFMLKVKGSFKRSNVFLFITFLLCLLTAFGAAFIFSDSKITSALAGTHNKIGLILIIAFVLHIWNYRKVIVSHIKRLA